MTKPSLVVYGNCQADWIERGLKSAPSIVSRFEVTYLCSFDHPVSGPAKPDLDVLGRCELLLEQRGGWDRFPWREAVPASAEVVTFPVLAMEALWPLTTFSDPRIKPELPEYPFGRFPYGDRLIADWLAAGVSREETLARYLSWPLREHEDLDRVREYGVVRLEMADEACDVQMADEMLAVVRDEPLFFTCNHPRPELLSRLADRVIQRATPLLGEAKAVSHQVGEFLAARRPNDNIHVPIHPDVADHFGLNWYRPDLTYRSYQLRDLSYEDYWRAYTQM